MYCPFCPHEVGIHGGDGQCKGKLYNHEITTTSPSKNFTAKLFEWVMDGGHKIEINVEFTESTCSCKISQLDIENYNTLSL